MVRIRKEAKREKHLNMKIIMMKNKKKKKKKKKKINKKKKNNHKRDWIVKRRD